MGLSSEDSLLPETTAELMLLPPIATIQTFFLSFAVSFLKVCRKLITLKPLLHLITLSEGEKADKFPKGRCQNNC